MIIDMMPAVEASVPLAPLPRSGFSWEPKPSDSSSRHISKRYHAFDVSTMAGDDQLLSRASRVSASTGKSPADMLKDADNAPRTEAVFTRLAWEWTLDIQQLAKLAILNGTGSNANVAVKKLTVPQPVSALTMGTGKDDVLPSISGQAVALFVKTVRGEAQLDDDAVGMADAAVSEATAFVAREDLPLPTRAMFSEEGLLTLQWRGKDRGIAIFFAGDGNATLSFKGPGYGYAQVGFDVPIGDRLPSNFWTQLSKVIS